MTPMLREFRARLNGRGVAAVALASLVAAAPAQSQAPRTECLARHYAAYASAQRDYQRTVERLVGSDATLRELAALARTEQIARIDARQRAVETLLRTTPRSVRVDRPVNQWLDWGRTEAEQLARTDTVFARLDAATRAAAEPIRDHPQWPKLRDAVRTRVQSTPEHRAALERLTGAMSAKPGCGGER